MSSTIKPAVSPSTSPLTTPSKSASVDWGDWASHGEVGAASAARPRAAQPAASPSAPASAPGKELGYAKEDGFDKFIRVMERVETALEKLTGTNRDELIARNADRSWRGPFRF